MKDKGTAGLSLLSLRALMLGLEVGAAVGP